MAPAAPLRVTLIALFAALAAGPLAAQTAAQTAAPPAAPEVKPVVATAPTPAATPAAPKLRQASHARQGAAPDADARNCLEFATRQQIVQCAEKYRH